MLAPREIAAFNARCRADDSVYDGDYPEPLTGRRAPVPRPFPATARAARHPTSLRPGLATLSLALGALLILSLGVAALTAPGDAPRAEAPSQDTIDET